MTAQIIQFPARSATVNASNGAAATLARRQAEEARIAAVAASHWTGAKYDRSRDIADTAKLVRADVAAAIKAGRLPRGTKVSVRISRYAGGRSMSLVVTALPAGIEVYSRDRMVQDASGRSAGEAIIPWMASGAREVLTMLESIANAYNFDKSDSMTDYFHVAFYVDASFSSELRNASRARVEASL